MTVSINNNDKYYFYTSNSSQINHERFGFCAKDPINSNTSHWTQ